MLRRTNGCAVKAAPTLTILVLIVAIAAVSTTRDAFARPSAEDATTTGSDIVHQFVGSDGFVVGFAHGVNETTARESVVSRGLIDGRWNPALRSLSVRFESSTRFDVRPAEIDALSAEPFVRYAEPNAIFTGADVPDDPRYSSHQWAAEHVGAESAWDDTGGTPNVVVAVLDTGMDLDHIDLEDEDVAGYDFVNDDNDPDDDHGHGTHVAGIIGAATDNTLGVASLGRDTAIMPVKVLNSSNQGTAADVADGVTWAADNGAEIINLSMSSTADMQVLRDAVEYAHDAGVLLIAAAGNNLSSTPRYPAAYDDVMAIAGTTSSDTRWVLSNRGDWLSMSAPAASIHSTDWVGGAGEYSTRSGTSASAAIVSGVAALMFAVDPTLSNTQVRTDLESTAVDLGSSGFDTDFGHGRVDAAAAVEEAGSHGSTSTPTPTNTPVPTNTPTPTATVMPDGPLIYSVRARRLRRTSARIQWSTNQSATRQVEYGLTDEYGSMTNVQTNRLTRHRVNLSGLVRNTTYHYRVISENAAGGESISADYTFRTKP